MCGCIDPDYVPNEIDFLHELHGPYFCVSFGQLYGRFSPTDSELSHAMNDLANYDPGSGKIPPESGSVMSDFASDSDSESGGPSLPSGVHSDMADLDDIDSVLQLPECVGFGDLRLHCSSGKIPPESGSLMVVLDFGSDVDSESGGPSLPSGVHSDIADMTDFDDIDSSSQMTECVGFGDPGLPCLSRKIPPESGYVTAMSGFASVADLEPNEPSLPSGVHSDMPDYADSDCVSQVSDCVNFGKPRSGTTFPESGCVTAMSDFASVADSEPNEPSLPSGIHLDMPHFGDCDNVSHVSDVVVLVITSCCKRAPQLAYMSGDTCGTVNLYRGFEERSNKWSISDVN